jgi:hypothetical protein
MGNTSVKILIYGRVRVMGRVNKADRSPVTILCNSVSSGTMENIRKTRSHGMKPTVSLSRTYNPDKSINAQFIMKIIYLTKGLLSSGTYNDGIFH